MNWFTNEREKWIADMLRIYGFINREHIKRKFGVSIPQASVDLQAFMRKYPISIKYNKTSKRYEAQ